MCFEGFGSFQVGVRLRGMLTAINLDDQTGTMAGEIGNVSADANLATEVRVGSLQSMAQVPPKFPLSIGRIGAHLPREDTLRQHGHAAIAAGPDAWLFSVFRHRSTPWRDPHP
jgi:hypothetical protein